MGHEKAEEKEMMAGEKNKSKSQATRFDRSKKNLPTASFSVNHREDTTEGYQ